MNKAASNQDKVIRACAIAIMISFIFAVYLGAFAARFGLNHYVFLFSPADRFNDWIHIIELSSALNPYAGEISGNYLPLSYLLVYPFQYLRNSQSILIYFIIFAMFMCWYCAYFLKEYHLRVSKMEFVMTICIFAFLSYPVLFTLDRANLEAWLFILVAMFALLFRNQHYKSSAVFLAFACAMKFYPAVFLILYCREKRYKEGLLCIILIVLFIIIPALCLEGSLLQNFAHLSKNNREGLFAFAPIIGNIFSESLFSYVRTVVFLFTHGNLGHFQQLLFGSVYSVYVVVTLVSFILICAYICRYRYILAVWKQIMLLTLVMILFTPVSYDYKLIYIFIPFLLFISDSKEERFLWRYAWVFILLLIPKVCMYAGFSHIVLAYNNTINLFVMLYCLGLITYDGISSITKDNVEFVDEVK